MNTYRLKGASGKVAGLSHDLGQRTLIGSDAACDVQVDDPKVAAQQAEIVLQADGSLRLRQLGGSSDVLLNGKVTNDALLNSGDEIRVGACRWVLQAPGLRPEKVLTERAVRRTTNWMPWLMATALLAAAALAWQRGWLSF